MSHSCADCGYEHDGPIVEPVVEVNPEPVAAAEVEIARIQAERDVAVARIEGNVEKGWQEQKLTELEARLAGMAETLAALAPPAPEPVPVTVAEPEPEPVAEPVGTEPPPPVEPAAPTSRKRSNPWW
jgi:hypothetical protein